MKIKKTKFKGLMVVIGIKHQDKRGYIRELMLEKIIRRKFKFQILSVSKKNVLRGLHFQVRKPQGKLISVLKGEIFDVAVDLRKNSKTYGKYFSICISCDDNISLFIPKGFAHGYLSLDHETLVSYKVDNYYNPKSECGIAYNDKSLNINWGLNDNFMIISEKDKNYDAYRW